MSRILIDGRFVGVGESVSRVTMDVLSEILKLDHENDYTLLIRPAGEKEIERYPVVVEAENCRIEVMEIPHYSISEQTKFLSYLNKEKFDLVHFTQFNHPVLYRGPYIVTIHDLTMLGHLHRQKFYRRIACNLTMKSAIQNSKAIISVSDFTKKEIIEFYGPKPEKITVTHLGIDHERFNLEPKAESQKLKAFKEKYKIPGDYILYTGAWKKHKNLIRLFQSYEEFVHTSHPELVGRQGRQSEGSRDSSAGLQNDTVPKLVLVGKIDTKEPEVTAEINKVNSSLSSTFNLRTSPIITTGFIEEEELPTAYAGAMAYVIPSLNEGFGLPPLEAMACGTPVIASKESCIPEVLGDNALYFDPYNIKDIADAITKISTDEKMRDDLVKKGLEHVKKFNWSETGKKTFDVYKRVLSHKS